MRGLRVIAVAAALAFGGGAALAQEAAAPVAAPVAASAETTAATVPAATETPAANLAGAGTAAEAGVGQPLGGWKIQPQVTALGERASDFNDVLLVIMAVITAIVFALLFWVMFRYRRSANPVPSKTSHNTFVEVVWTLVPVLILVGIAVPSFQLLAAQYDPPKADVTIKATGHQWYWSYEYPDQGGFGFDAVMLSDDEAKAAGEPKMLATDNRVVVPEGAVVKVLVTAADVLHSWAMPAFWVKIDAVPGKINELWFKAEKAGLYYGQCSELCGTKHGFMPIAVEVVSKDKFDAWVAARQADAGIDPVELAATQAKAAKEALSGPASVAVPTAAPVEPQPAPAVPTPEAPAGAVVTN